MGVRIGTGLVVGLAAMFLASAASAQNTPSARQLELAQRYVAAIHMERTFDATMDAVLPSLKTSGGALPPEKQEAVLEAVRDVTKSMMADMTTRMAPLLAEVFTEKELEDLVAFYEGPTGRSMIDKSPLLAAKMAPMMRDLVPQMQVRMAERICKITDCPPSAAAKK
jgi:hypothetical protein